MNGTGLVPRTEEMMNKTFMAAGAQNDQSEQYQERIFSQEARIMYRLGLMQLAIICHIGAAKNVMPNCIKNKSTNTGISSRSLVIKSVDWPAGTANWIQIKHNREGNL
mmetsp:Transcript_8331/g.16700  ORF Transcript_8331/g.16700 Transcript_8331/m.16700 type:complete len:108 (+) Transcript_8331:2547-2870(+)